MNKISLLDTSICDSNLGNQIIMDSINKIINDLFYDDFIFRLQYLENFGITSLKYMKESEHTFFCGTNSLSSKMNRYSQMGFRIKDLFYVNNLVLFGVGWWQYQENPNLYTKFLLKHLLHRNIIHSARDDYTVKMLSSIGIKNVINTSCPTTWNLTKDFCSSIPVEKSANVILTFTDYMTDYKKDLSLIQILLKNYKKVFIWLQGANDFLYIEKLKKSIRKDYSKIILIPPKLNAFDKILQNNDIDYIGTRLHAGIRALQNKRRTIIIAIDNRAKEIHKDININIVNREDIDNLEELINGNIQTEIDIPEENIKKFIGQFK